MVDDFRDGFSLKQIAWIVTGRSAARSTFSPGAQGRPPRASTAPLSACMGSSAPSIGCGRSTPDPTASARRGGADRPCARPPKRVARVVEEGFPTPASARRTSPGHLVFLDLGKAGWRRRMRARCSCAAAGISARRKPSSPSSSGRSGARRAEAGNGAMSEDVIFTPLASATSRSRTESSARISRAASTTRTARYPDAHQLGMQVRQGWHRRDHLVLRAGADRRPDHRGLRHRASRRLHPAVGRARRGGAQFGCKFIMQLSHSGRQMDMPGVHNQHRPALSSTSRKESLHGFLCQAMTKREIDHTGRRLSPRARGGRARPDSTASSCMPPTATCSRNSSAPASTTAGTSMAAASPTARASCSR